MSRSLGNQKIKNSYPYLLQKRDGVILDGDGNVVNLEGRVVLTDHTSGSLSGLSVYWFADTTSGSVQGELNPEGDKIFIKDSGGNASNDPIYIYAPAGQTINGNASEAIDVDWGWVEYYRVGSEWKTLAGQGYIPPAPEIPTPEEVGAIPTAEKGVANGVATLDGDGLVVQNPADIINGLKTPFAKSAVISAYGQLFAWDSFQRADGPIGVSDSGHTWVNLKGTGGANIASGIAMVNTVGDIVAIDVSGFSADKAQLEIEWGTSPLFSTHNTYPGNRTFLYVMKDADNGVSIRLTNQFVQVAKIVGGITTDIGGLNVFNSGTLNTRSRSNNFTRISANLFFGQLDFSSRMCDLSVTDVKGSNTAYIAPLASLVSDGVFDTASDIKYVGIAGASYIKIWKR